ncbi:hypothetical protein GCM10027341_04970 [Spirosoma knui]
MVPKQVRNFKYELPAAQDVVGSCYYWIIATDPSVQRSLRHTKIEENNRLALLYILILTMQYRTAFHAGTHEDTERYHA